MKSLLLKIHFGHIFRKFSLNRITVRLKFTKNLPQNSFPSRRRSFPGSLLVEPGKRQSGFTLVELIMVIVITGALSALAFSQFNRHSFDVAVASGELIQAIRYTQSQSINHSGAGNYQIAISGTGYTVTQDGVAITHPLTGAAGYTKTWPDITLDTATTIVFDAWGNPVSLSAPLTITLSKELDSNSVTVEDVTGFTR